MARSSTVKTPQSEPVFGVAAPFAGGWVFLPERVRIIDDVLEWSDWIAVGEMQRGRIDEACLRTFVRLADAPPASIEAFALRYGPLYLGPDGLTVATADELPSRVDREECPPTGASVAGGATDSPGRVWYQEPVEGWRAWARYVRTILVLYNALRGAKTGITPDRHLYQARIPLGPPEPMHNDNPSMERYVAHLRRLSPGLMRRLREAAKGPEGQHAHELYLTVYDRLSPWRLCRLLEDAKCPDRQCTHERCAHKQWEYLILDVNERLLAVANFTVCLRGTRDNPRVDLEQLTELRIRRSVDSALPTIASQLLASLTDQGRTQLCHDCRLPYPCLRRRQKGRCPECERLARNARVRASKARAKAKREAEEPAQRERTTPITTPIPANTHEQRGMR